MTGIDTQVTQPTGAVFDIKRFAIHDGPGVRTTVFLKGCPLRCIWCHNPHSQRAKREVAFQQTLCSHCGRCVVACPHGCHEVAPGMHTYDRTRCTQCGLCMPVCVSGALSYVGQMRTVADVLAEVLKDRNYYRTSGGGVTLSGGEPMMQFRFTKALLAAAKAEGLHTVLDTCGYAEFDKYAEIMPLVDLVHYDIKELDPDRHREYTGKSNERILANLHKIDELGTPIILRCPIIPGLNDRDDHLEGLGPLANECRNVTAIHILPFHPYGSTHAEKLGMEFTLATLEAASDDQADGWIRQAAAHSPVPVSKG